MIKGFLRRRTGGQIPALGTLRPEARQLCLEPYLPLVPMGVE